jgi:hypothetical protein
MKTADELAAIAVQLAIRVRDEHPEANGQWLAKMLPDAADRWALVFVLAAAVDVDRSWTDLTGWASNLDEHQVIPLPAGPQPGKVQPCGTTAAARRHQYNGEPMDLECREAERARDRARRARRRSRGAAA